MSKGIVPFYLCRRGAVVEFDIYGINRKERGTVNAIYVAGARNFLVELSESVDSDGNMRSGICDVTGSLRAVNLDHATRVLEHGTGELVFAEREFPNIELRQELAEARGDGTISRRGKRLVIDGNRKYAPNVVRTLLLLHVSDNRAKLGWLPWEILDLDGLSKQLERVGIVKFLKSRITQRVGRRVYEDPDVEFVSGAEVNTEKLKRFLKANFNRFKVDLNEERRANDRLDEEMYRRDEELEEERYAV
jgi:hypothetical protein